MKRNIRLLTVIIGCLLAMVIVCSQVYSAKSTTTLTTEQADDASHDDSSTSSISMASFSLPSPVNVQINLDPHCLFEIVFEHVKEEAPEASLPSVEEKLMVTLFRVIIAPNAP